VPANGTGPPPFFFWGDDMRCVTADELPAPMDRSSFGPQHLRTRTRRSCLGGGRMEQMQENNSGSDNCENNVKWG
jgi:hypothetical protein